MLRAFIILTLAVCAPDTGLMDGRVHAQSKQIDFARDIKPLLSDRCFLCHGPDETNRQAELRLDSSEGLVAPLESDSDKRAVVPGKPETSVLVQRIFAEDSSEVMPPPDSGLVLSAQEKELLRAWVRSGAQWETHWAFQRIRNPVPPVSEEAWCSGPIDQFVSARHKEAGLTHNPAASKEQLIRTLFPYTTLFRSRKSVV